MGAGIKDPKIQGQLKKLEGDTAHAGAELEGALLDSAIDLVGIVDPTPISDAIGLARSAARGDWIGAGLSVISMLPYAGDAIAKPLKGAKITGRILALKKRIADNVTKARQIVVNTLKSDAAAIRVKRAAKKGENLSEELIHRCPMEVNRYGSHTPKKGWESSGERGNGPWNPGKSGMDSDKVKEIESVTQGKPVNFKEGYPDFSEYTYQAKGVDGKAISGDVEIELSKAGNREQDFARARVAMAEKLGLNEFEEPRHWTWHHMEDGTTMQLLPTNLHKNVPHTGGVSIAKDPSY
ncbi:MAG: HNH endonuclease [Candidatus Methylumidiphilus sp.]